MISGLAGFSLTGVDFSFSVSKLLSDAEKGSSLSLSSSSLRISCKEDEEKLVNFYCSSVEQGTTESYK